MLQHSPNERDARTPLVLRVAEVRVGRRFVRLLSDPAMVTTGHVARHRSAGSRYPRTVETLVSRVGFEPAQGASPTATAAVRASA